MIINFNLDKKKRREKRKKGEKNFVPVEIERIRRDKAG
jgi:hypothetical protein